MVSNKGAPRIAFQVDPQRRALAGMAHATITGQDTALCGVHTPFLSGSWPAPGQPWTEPYCRCPTCAHRLYAGTAS